MCQTPQHYWHYITFLGSFLFCCLGNSPPIKNIQPTAVLWSETDTDEGLEDSKDFSHSPFSSDCQCHSNEKCNAVSAWLVCDLQDDKHGSVDGRICMNLKALETELFQQSA